MELLLLFIIAAVGGVLWLNHVMNKKSLDEAKANLVKQEAEAPYKVDIPDEKVSIAAPVEQTPAQSVIQPTKCGCGRSPTGFCVGLHRLTETEWSGHADNPNKNVTEKPLKRPRKPTTKTSAAQKTTNQKTAGTKSPVKKPKK